MDNTLKIKPEVAIEAEVKKEVKYKKVGSLRVIKGLTIFTYNPITGDIKKLEVKKKALIGFDKKVVEQAKATHDPNVVYIQALNLKNAKRKATKMLTKAREQNERRINNSK